MVKTDSNLFWVRKIISIQIWQHRSDALNLQILWFLIVIFYFIMGLAPLWEIKQKNLMTKLLDLF